MLAPQRSTIASHSSAVKLFQTFDSPIETEKRKIFAVHVLKGGSHEDSCRSWDAAARAATGFLRNLAVRDRISVSVGRRWPAFVFGVVCPVFLFRESGFRVRVGSGYDSVF